jgi:hypothetical protein
MRSFWGHSFFCPFVLARIGIARDGVAISRRDFDFPIGYNAQNFRNRWCLEVNNVEIAWGTRLAGLAMRGGSVWLSL